MRYIKYIGFLFLILFFAGCVSGGYGSMSYHQGQVGSIQSIYRGVIVGIRNIEIQDDGTGTIGGAITGGAIGSLFGGTTKDQQLATATGALLGAAAGNRLNTNSGQELTIRLDNGKEFVTVHRISQSTPYSFRVGDRVRVYESGGQVRRIELD